MSRTVRTLAIALVLALLAWGAAEATAAARPGAAEPPASISLEDDRAHPATADVPPDRRATHTTHVLASIAVGHDGRSGSPAHAHFAWHPTRHACDDSADH